MRGGERYWIPAGLAAQAGGRMIRSPAQPDQGFRVKPEAERPTTNIIRVIAVLAAAITLYQVSRPGFLLGITPDISAWLGGSIRFVHGAMPYRDFDLLQPPGFARSEEH